MCYVYLETHTGHMPEHQPVSADVKPHFMNYKLQMSQLDSIHWPKLFSSSHIL